MSAPTVSQNMASMDNAPGLTDVPLRDAPVQSISQDGSGSGVGSGKANSDTYNANELMVVDACCCCANLLYCGPGCIGCAYEDECCCMYEACCCKLGTSPLMCKFGGFDNGSICHIGCVFYQCGLRMPRTCCACRANYCCLVSQGAFPTTSEIPCMVGTMCITCFPKFGCCLTQGAAQGNKTEAVAVSPPQAAS